MKTFKILGLIALLAMLFEFVGGFRDGWNEVDEYTPISMERTDPGYNKATPVTFDVLPDTAISLVNPQIGVSVPAGFTQCRSYVSISGMTIFANVLLAITGLASLYGFYCLIRVLISVVRKDIFSPFNIRRMRWSIYSIVFYHIAKYFQLWSETQDAMAQLKIPGYTIQAASPFDFSWMYMAVLILLTEVFVVAIRLKQENDLTI